MIFRPVSPVSADGPPSSNRPVGLANKRYPPVVDAGRQQRRDDVLDQVAR